MNVGYLIRRDTNNLTISLMKVFDCILLVPLEHLEYVPQSRRTRVPRSRIRFQWMEIEIVKSLEEEED